MASPEEREQRGQQIDLANADRVQPDTGATGFWSSDQTEQLLTPALAVFAVTPRRVGQPRSGGERSESIGEIEEIAHCNTPPWEPQNEPIPCGELRNVAASGAGHDHEARGATTSPRAYATRVPSDADAYIRSPTSDCGGSTACTFSRCRTDKDRSARRADCGCGSDRSLRRFAADRSVP